MSEEQVVAALQGTPDDPAAVGALPPEAAPQGTPDEGAEDTYKQRYENLQKVLGKQGDELGELRKWREEFMKAQAATPAKPAEPEPDPDAVELRSIAEAKYQQLQNAEARKLRNDGWSAADIREKLTEMEKELWDDAVAEARIISNAAEQKAQRKLREISPDLDRLAQGTIKDDIGAMLAGDDMPKGISVDDLAGDIQAMNANVWRNMGQDARKAAIAALAWSTYGKKVARGEMAVAGSTPKTPPAAAPAVNVPKAGGAGVTLTADQAQTAAFLKRTNPYITDEQINAIVTKQREAK